ncbi:MAG: tRNA (adenosine(37)-N6)-threonylcarbamoyltransferase complex ATPase subunit type 1 TsaE [Candidatus Brocadiia bacterium]
MSVSAIHLRTESPEGTIRMAEAWAPQCRPGDVIGLEGTLGAGKTCFVKGLARGLGVGEQTRVLSPTFVLLRRYEGRLTVHHFDAYRMADAAEMEAIGCEEIFEGDGVSVVEWADHVAGCLPPDHFMVSIEVTGATTRSFAVSASRAAPAARLEGLGRALAPWRA